MDTVDKSNDAKPSIVAPKYYSDEETRWVMDQHFRYSGYFATPILQIFSISISTNFDECEVYGVIRATQLKDHTVFDLYNRDISDYELISKDSFLSITGPEDDAILGHTRILIDICLKDRKRNIDLVKGQHYLDCEVDDTRDKLIKAVIEGENATVCLNYTTFRFANYAVVKVAIIGGDNEVFGSLVASYSNSRYYCTTEDEVKCLETKLFDTPSDKHVLTRGGFPIKLMRSVVAVPAYSKLVIKMDLSSHQRLLTRESLEYRVELDSYKNISFENGYVEVNVKWEHAYRRLYKESVIRMRGYPNVTGCTEKNTEEQPKKIPRQLLESTSLSDEPFVSSSNPNGKSKIRTWRGVEIFSVYIGGINHEVSTLYGSIKVKARGRAFYIYNKSESEAEPLRDDKTVCLDFKHTVTTSTFSIILDLNGPGKGLEISFAEMSWDSCKAEITSLMTWFDKRICSVAQGKDGYAAVHYMIFKDAVEAFIEVSLICDNHADVPSSLYGLICARYSEHEYSTEYEKLYYKSRLFDKQQHNPEKLSALDLKVPLIKSAMVVPISSSLIIEADLRLSFSNNPNKEIVYDEEDFTIDVSKTTSKKIGKGAYRIEVSLTFDDSFFFGKNR